MKTKKRLISFILVFAALLALSTSAFAAQPPVYETRYIAVSRISADLTLENSLGLTCSTGNVVLSDGYTAVCTLELMEIVNSLCDPIKTWTASGSMSVVFEKYYYVTPGRYLVQMTAEIYDANNNYVETATVASRIITYPA